MPSLFAPVVMHSVHRSNNFKKTSYINGMFISILKTQTDSVLKECLLLKAGIIFYPTNGNPILCVNELCVSKKCVFFNCQYLRIRIYISVNISRSYATLTLDVIYSLMEYPLIVVLRVK